MDTKGLEETIRQAVLKHLKEQPGAVPGKIKIRMLPQAEPEVRLKVGGK